MLFKPNQLYNIVEKLKSLTSERMRVYLLKDVYHCSTKKLIEKLFQLRLMMSLVANC